MCASETATDAGENERLIAQLQCSLERKERWLTAIAHEMRAPFAPILRAVQTLGRPGGEPFIIDQACVTLTRQVARLLRLVDDLFDLAEVESASAFIRRVTLDLEAVIAAALESVGPVLAARGHRVELKTEPQLGIVAGDGRSLNRVFVSLLANAARYTGNGGRICVVAEREPGWVIVKVRDSGAGIPQGMLPRVFDAYVRIERGSGVSNESPGFGLALTRHLVELHGGTVTALSEGVGLGSELVVRLPAARAIECTGQNRAGRGDSLAAS